MITTRSARRSALPLLLAGLLSIYGATVAHAAGATRTWVSGVGDDANPCSRTAPCKTFAGAISKTADGGEINALDPGGYGPVTITHAITIDGGGFESGVLNTYVNGIIINAAPTDDIVLRGLDIEGGAATVPGTCGYGGLSGVWVRNAGTVRVEDSHISSQANGVRIAPEASDPKVSLRRVGVNKICQTGIDGAPSAGHTSAVSVSDSSVTNAGIGLRAADGAHLWFSGTTLFGNGTGLLAEGTGVIDSVGGNHVYGNGTDGTPTHSTGEPIAGPPGPQGPKGDPAFKLVIAPAATSLRAAAGRRVAIRYAAMIAAKSTLSITRGGRTISTVRAKARAGRNTITWNGRKGRRRAAPGRYVLKLRAVSANGQTATAKIALRVSARS